MRCEAEQGEGSSRDRRQRAAERPFPFLRMNRRPPKPRHSAVTKFGAPYCGRPHRNHLLRKETLNMPEKKTIERALEDKREGKAPSTQAGEFVREEMEH